MRVQIPAYTDRWKMGDRYGILLVVSHSKTLQEDGTPWDVATVKLDVSGKIQKFLLDDCIMVS